MKFIVAEKPTLMRTIVAAIESSGIKMLKVEKYNTGDEWYYSHEYCITSCFGHLFTMCDPEEYNEKWKKWSIDTLPFVPENFLFKHKLKQDDGVYNRFNLICKLVARPDVDCVIGAGDADAEGQRIGDLALGQAMRIAKVNKPFLRLWVNDLTNKSIMKGLNNLKPNSDYISYRMESETREAYDFLVGINYSRLASCKYGDVIHVGRVSGCIIKTIAEKDKEINDFVPVKYKILESTALTDGHEFSFKSSIYDTRKGKWTVEELKEIAQKYNELNGFVSSVKRTNKAVVQSPKMFNTTALQSFMSERYKWSIERTTKALQWLYENGYSSYPRTDADVYHEEEKDEVENIIEKVNKNAGEEIVKNKRDTNRIYDSSRVTSHSCISITSKLPDLKTLASDERELYMALYNHFCAVFCKEVCYASKIKLTIQIGSYESWDKDGESITQLGWQKFEKPLQQKKNLPDFNEGDVINVKFQISEKETIPPKHLSVKALNAFLERPFAKKKKKDEDDEDEFVYEEISQEDMQLIKEGCQIGTAATRSPLIEQAIKRGYFSNKNGYYYISQKGLDFLNIINQLKIDVSPKTTAFMGRELMRVAGGKRTQKSFLEEEFGKINQVILDAKSVETIKTTKQKTYANQNIICKCPVCKTGDIIDMPKVYGCSNNDLVFFKQSKLVDFLSKTSYPFSAELVKEVCEKGQIKVCHIPSTKKIDASGNPIYYDANFELCIQEQNIGSLKMMLNNQTQSQSTTSSSSAAFATCPKCKGKINKTEKGWFCENNDFKLYKENKFFIVVAKRNIEDQDALSFIHNGYVELSLTNDYGKTYKKKMLMSLNETIYPQLAMEKKKEIDAPFDYTNMGEEELLKYKIADCKKCGGIIVKTNWGYQCMNNDFKLYLDNYYTKTNKGMPLSEYEANQLVTKGEVIADFITKDGNKYKAKIIMTIDTERPESIYPLFQKEYVKTTYKQKGNQFGGSSSSYFKSGSDTFGTQDNGGINKKGNIE